MRHEISYKTIVVLSNNIRLILQVSRELRMAAINAALAARRVGDVKGFQTVAGELKIFGQKVEEDMQLMSKYIFSLAKNVSDLQRERLGFRHHERTLAESENSEIVARAMQRGRDRVESLYALLEQSVGVLEIHLNYSNKLCNSGRALARAAMVEAVYGGDGAAMLKQVAQEIDDTVYSITTQLKKISYELAGVGE